MGTCSVDVLDPTDPVEIGDKLRSIDFAHFVVTQEDLSETKWSFQPFIGDPIENS